MWRGQPSAVILDMAASARLMSRNDPDTALKLAYAICQLPDRLAVQLSGVDYGLVDHLRALVAKGIALDVVASVYCGQGRLADASAAYLDAYEEFSDAKDRVRAARSFVLALTSLLAAGYKDPDQEAHALDLIRATLQVLEDDRGTLRDEDSRASWISSQRELYAAVFSELSKTQYSQAKAGELGLWLLESLHRTMTANLMLSEGAITSSPALLAALTELTYAEASHNFLAASRSNAPNLDSPDLEMLRERVRNELSGLQTTSFIAQSTDVEAALAGLGDSLALLYHCWREKTRWVVHSVLVSSRHGIRIHQAQLDVKPESEDIAAFLTQPAP